VAIAVVFAVVVSAALAAMIGNGVGDEASGRENPSAALGANLPAAPRSALDIGDPRALADRRATGVWAPVLRPTMARSGPRAGARRIARVAVRTPEGTTNILSVLDRRRDARGRLWVRVRLAVLPNGTTGWVPRSTLGGLTAVRTRLVVDLGRLRATLTRGRRVLLRVPVGVGRPGAPTPTGDFYIRDRLTTYRSATYGPVAFGTSARSSVLTDWPAGGYIGIHGTDRPDLLPGRVSHGCIRMRNADVVRLSRLMPVGTPVTVRA
jgi:lipoprotein-anchoring transpeptidase ErfK/SrfK